MLVARQLPAHTECDRQKANNSFAHSIDLHRSVGKAGTKAVVKEETTVVEMVAMAGVDSREPANM